MTSYAIRLHAADAAVTVTSATKAVTDWSHRYFGPWWNACQALADGTGPVITAEVDEDSYAERAATVTNCAHQATTYAKAHTLIAQDQSDGVIRAVSPGEGLAYTCAYRTGEVAIHGLRTEPVALAAARLAREAMRGVLLRQGWVVLHASAVVRDQQAVLTFGPKGAGKTTTALALAAHGGWQLLANDRVFARADGPTAVQVLPWPSAAAIGLGLLDALGWYDIARTRLQAGELLHPTQDQQVTDALLAGNREPLWEGGRELKVQVFPDQFATWFGLALATGGHAHRLLFPGITKDARPAFATGDKHLTERDFMSGKTEDRYPDVFGLGGGIDSAGRAEDRREVARRLDDLPHHSLLLGHDLAANADLLTTLTTN